MRSAPGEGSTFSFTLPLFGASAQARAPLVVVAAPDAGTRREVRRVAEELGFAVHEATDGVEAVESAARLRPAVVVLDRILPRLRAEEVAERLRAQAATRGGAPRPPRVGRGPRAAGRRSSASACRGPSTVECWRRRSSGSARRFTEVSLARGSRGGAAGRGRGASARRS